MDAIVLSEEPLMGWDDLVLNCPWGSFYHSQNNLEIIKGVSPARIVYIAALDEEDNLVGGLALGIQEGSLGSVVNCLPYFGSYGDAIISSLAKTSVEKQLYNRALEYSQEIDALCFTVITSPFAEAVHHQQVRKWLEPTFMDERCCQIVHLPSYSGEEKQIYTEKVLGQIQGRARTVYRKIVRSGLLPGRVETGTEALEFSQIHRENIGGKGGVFKTEAFFKLAFAMSQESPRAAELDVMRDRNLITGGVVLFYFKDTVEYHTTCLREEYRSIGPLTGIIIDRLIEAGMDGYRYWNFGGTWRSQVGVYKFKSSFGARDHPYFYFTKFLRSLNWVKTVSAEQIVRDYPLCFVIPFSELGGGA